MIRAAHTLVYSDDSAATRAFFREVLQWPFVVDVVDTTGEDRQMRPHPRPAEASNDDWLIFATGPSEMGVHPTAFPGQTVIIPPHHEISLLCDDLEGTIAELRSRGAQFDGDPVDRGFGICVNLKVPGSIDILLYEPRHGTAYNA